MPGRGVPARPNPRPPPDTTRHGPPLPPDTPRPPGPPPHKEARIPSGASSARSNRQVEEAEAESKRTANWVGAPVWTRFELLRANSGGNRTGGRALFTE